MEVSLNRSHAVTTGYSSIQNDTPRDVEPSKTRAVVGHLHAGGSGSDEDVDFELIVPTWRTWNFTRTLSYWIAILYLEGSVLFVIGGAFSMTDLVGLDLRLEQGLVDGPYFAGGVCFGLGAYCGVLQVLNVHNKDSKRQLVWCGSCRQWSKAAKTVGKSAAAAYLTYFVGALLFQVGVGGGLVQNKTKAVDLGVDWITAVAGSICFVIGGLIEVIHNTIWRRNIVCTTRIFWLGFCNFIGGVLFLFAATSGLTGIEDANLVRFLVDLPYAVGSALFLVGSMLSLLMWKNEQFGLSLLSYINPGGKAYFEGRTLESETALQMHAEYGCGKSEDSQMVWLFIYVLNAAASAVLLSLLLSDVYVTASADLWTVNDICGACVGLIISHGVLVLASVIHHVPTVAPHKQLLWFLRITMVLYTANAWLQVSVLSETYLGQATSGGSSNATTMGPSY